MELQPGRAENDWVFRSVSDKEGNALRLQATGV